MKLFEYMAAGIPVIASNFPAWKEIIDGVKCGLVVDPLRPEEIARAIEFLLTHPVEAEEMGRRGEAAVRDTYNWHSQADVLFELYARLIHSDPSQSLAYIARAPQSSQG